VKKKPMTRKGAAKKVAPKKAAPRKVKPIPDGYHAITPYLSIRDATSAIAFYTKAFGAKLTVRMDAPGGKVGHAEMKIGDSVVMLADEAPEMDFVSPQARGGTSVLMHLYVKDVDATVEQAVRAGAKMIRPVQDQFYGDRAGGIEDPYGHRWYIATHKEELTPAQIRKRMAESMRKGDSG
jgi:PhnB protein